MDRERGRPPRLALAAVGLLLVPACGALIWWAAPEPEPASVAWPEASPESEPLDADAFERLTVDLAGRNTQALLIARRGRMVVEWYAPDFGPNERHYTAAMAKGTAAMPALLAAAGNGLLSLDDRVADWVPSWGTDPERAKVRLRDLAFHASGLEDVDFDAGEAGELPGWQQGYYDHPDERFRLALDSAALRFAPGTGYGYSGVGYYVLSYVVSRALQNGPPAMRDIPSFLGGAVYGPLGIPPDAWSIGYARSDTVDGLALTHFGSGGELTARAAARIGQLILDGGCHEGRQLLDAELVDLALGEQGVTPVAEGGGEPSQPASAAGWWRGGGDAWPSVPASAAVALGAGHQVVLIDPDRDLVAVRMGGDLSQREEPFQAALDRYLLGPLYAALEEAEASRGRDPGVADTPRDRGERSTQCAS